MKAFADIASEVPGTTLLSDVGKQVCELVNLWKIPVLGWKGIHTVLK